LAILAAFSFLPAVVTGLLHAQEMSSATPELQEVIQFHRNLALAGGVLMLLAAGLRLWLRRSTKASPRAAYGLLLVAALVLGMIAGHQGGIIAHS
jgi:heme A synthase